MSSKDYLTNDKVSLSREVLLPSEEDSCSRSHLPIEDRVMKEVSQFFGQELLPRLGVKELHTGINTYRIHYISMKDFDADERLRRVEVLQETTGLERADLVEILLTPLMAGKSDMKDRIRRTLRILRKERERLGEENDRRMTSILYALATKFLKEDDLNEMKEEFGMTILGQMLYDDGRKAGLEEGKAEGKAEGAEMNLVRNICSLMETMKLSAEQAMEALQVPKAEWGKYSKLL